MPEETRFQSGGDHAVLRKEGVHHDSMDFSGWENGQFSSAQSVFGTFTMWHTYLFCSPVLCVEYWFFNEKFAGVSEWASRTPCPSADDRKDWEAGPFVSLMVYKGQMLVCGQLQENFHLKQSSGKMYLNPQNGALSVLTMEESQWLQPVKCCSTYLGSGRNIYH